MHMASHYQVRFLMPELEIILSSRISRASCVAILDVADSLSQPHVLDQAIEFFVTHKEEFLEEHSVRDLLARNGAIALRILQHQSNKRRKTAV